MPTDANASFQWLKETGNVIITYRGRQHSLDEKARSYEEALLLANRYMKEQDESSKQRDKPPESSGWV